MLRVLPGAPPLTASEQDWAGAAAAAARRMAGRRNRMVIVVGLGVAGATEAPVR
jgi:hypothetical protein